MRALTWRDIDAVVIGKAPDMFEGVMMPELYLADALGAAGKPMMRVHTAGSVGGSTAIVAASLIQAGIHERVLTVAFEKQSRGQRDVGAHGPHPVPAGDRRGRRRLLRAAHPRLHPCARSAPEDTGIKVALKDRLNALKNPYAHLVLPRRHLEMVEGLADAVGPDPLPGDVPVVRRRLRDGARERRGGEDGAEQAGVGARRRRCGASRRCSRAATR